MDTARTTAGCALLLTVGLHAPTLATDGYVGSLECRGCHTGIYEDWSATRHANSVLTAGEARAAGYPLPRDAAASWGELSHIVGGRQRIAYVDPDGRVLDTSYHHRLGGWSAFPARAMIDCGPCHFTGFDSGRPAGSAGLPVPAAERNIGCEACHGPGRRHSETLEPGDIVRDASSRACGSCHTSVGRVLPRDDVHETHDVVQNWNRDPHANGLRGHSQSTFCAGCHSPLEAGPESARQDGATRPVFSEDRRALTCVACHDPHASTDPRYRRDRAELGPPRPPRRHVYRGDDGDFTTRDFAIPANTVESCEQCHRGADRIDLDHAGASCEDCHNAFQRNRGRESRPFRDANHRSLSCRPCHADADHLMAIAFRDPAFLDPVHLHNLRTLPAGVAERHGFDYPRLRRRRLIAVPEDPGALEVDETLAVARLPRPGVGAGGSADLERILRQPPHAGAVDGEAVRRLAAALREQPEAPQAWAALAGAYIAAGSPAAALDLLERTAGPAGSGAFRQLLFLAGSGRAASAHAGAPQTGSNPSARPAAHWLLGFEQLAGGRFEEASATLSRLRSTGFESAALRLHLALAQLGARDRDALATLLDARDAHPEHAATHVAAGVVAMFNGRMGPAAESLERAIELAPDHALAHYYLGRVRRRLGDPPAAADAFRAAIQADPGELNAYFFLADAYRAAGTLGAAVETYRALIRERPDLFHPRNELANVYKYVSDRLTYAHLAAVEAPPRHEATGRSWSDHLGQVRRRALDYGELALAEYRRAAALEELDVQAERQVAEIHRRAGRTEAALEILERLTARNPEWWIGPYRTGALQLARGRFDAAARSLERAIRLAPTQGASYVALGLVRIRQGRPDEAVRVLELGTVYDPFSPALFTNLGAALADRGDLDRARAALERSLRLETFPLPRTHLAHTNLALVLLRQRDRTTAESELRRALHAYPDYAYARHLLEALGTGDEAALADADYVHDDLLEIAGEVTTVAFRP